MLDTIEKLLVSAKILHRIGHSTRLAILILLYQEGSLNVGQVRDALKLEQSQTTRHLNKLLQVKVIKRERIGKFVFYSIHFNEFEKLLYCLKCIIEKDKNRL